MKKILSPIQMMKLFQKADSNETLAQFYQRLIDVHERFIGKVDKLDDLINKKVGPKGDRGPIGPVGKEGKSGDIKNIDEVVTIVHSKIKVPKDGEHGFTPKKGIHYFTEEDINHVAKRAAGMVKIPQAQEKEIDPGKILDAISKMPEGKRIPGKFIDGLEQTMSALRNQTRRGYLHGAGITELTAGANIILTKDGNGNYIIASTGGASLVPITVSGTIDNSNVNFTAATPPTMLNINGAFYLKTGGAYTWTYSGGNIALNNPVGVGGSIFGI